MFLVTPQEALGRRSLASCGAENVEWLCEPLYRTTVFQI